jgi:hypothetical protein
MIMRDLQNKNPDLGPTGLGRGFYFANPSESCFTLYKQINRAMAPTIRRVLESAESDRLLREVGSLGGRVYSIAQGKGLCPRRAEGSAQN